MPLSLAELRAACENKTKMRCDGYPKGMFIHQVFEAEQEVSLGFKKGNKLAERAIKRTCSIIMNGDLFMLFMT